jgi:hypothetical protein
MVDSMNKLAWKYNKPGHIKKVRLFDDADILSAIRRQPAMRKHLSGYTSGDLRRHLKRQAKDGWWDGVTGTIYSTLKGNSIAFNKKYWKSLNPVEKRNVYYHEMFHANRPILGKSEILAHAYGGYKSGQGVGRMLLRAAKTRPIRVSLETGLVATPLVVAVKLLSAVKKIPKAFKL